MTILKQKDFTNNKDPRRAAGDQQEKDVAFYLRRAFKDDENFLILNDYHFSFNGETAQIDHLVVHRTGFIIIESKSIYGEVKVNELGEWSRSYKGVWSGMSSPLIQAELQQDLLKQFLSDNVEQFLGKLFGVQMQVGGRDWSVLCTVSNNCILHRNEMPKAINKQIVKSESIAEEVRRLGSTSKVAAAWASKPYFSDEELKNIGEFLLDATLVHAVEEKTAEYEQTKAPKGEPDTKEKAAPQPMTQEDGVIGLVCKNCGETKNLTAMYGKYGYYVQCGQCNTNTSMKTPCPSCGQTKTRIRKRSQQYWLSCECSLNRLLFVSDV